MTKQTSSLNDKMQLYYNITNLPIHIFSDDEYILSFCNGKTEIENYIPWIKENIFPSLKKQEFHAIINFKYTHGESFLLRTLKIYEVYHYIIVGPVFIGNSLNDIVKKLLLNDNSLLPKKNELLNELKDIAIISKKDQVNYRQLFYTLFSSDYKKETIDFTDKVYACRIKHHENYFFHPPYKLEINLISCIRSGNKLEALKIAELLNAYQDASLATTPLRSYKNSLICRSTLYSRAIIDSGVTPKESFILSDTYINQIEITDSIQQLYHLDLKMLSKFIDKVNNNDVGKYSPIIRKAMRYIKKEVTEKLCINDLAASLFVSPSYLSQIFKKEVGITLKDFITKQKIEESKYFLRFSDNTIADVAAFFSFSSQSHYTKAFRKTLGITPKAYRDQL